jgi:outer membrane lipoprotein-sorting protein
MKSWMTMAAILLACLLPAWARAEFLLDSKSTADQALDALDQRGKGLKDFSAEVSLSEIDELAGDTTTNSGKIWYQAKGAGDSRIRVIFDTRKVGNRVDPNARREYVLDNGILTELDYKHKLRIDRQVLKPGEKMNLIKLGEGPFPLPVGQAKEDVKKLFDVKKIDPAKDDPEGTAHLQLIPKKGTQFARKFKKLDVYVDNKTNFPRRIDTEDKNGLTVRKTELTDVKVNPGVGDKDFELPKLQGWTNKTEMLGD